MLSKATSVFYTFAKSGRYMAVFHRFPSFMCIGAQKAGTTSLQDALVQHPQIFLPKVKETHFFVREDRFSLGFEDYQQRYFGEASTNQIIGEIDPEYLFFPIAAPRIKQYLGENLKFIIILREPVSRAFSHYQMSQRRGLETLDFKTAILQEPERTLTDTGFRHFSYISRSQYLKQIKAFQAHFPNAQFLFLLFEQDIQQSLNKTLTKITDFLGISSFSIQEDIVSNPASTPRFAFLRNMIYDKQNPLRKLIGKLIPRKYKLQIAQTADSLNQKKLTHSIKIDAELKEHIFNQYFLAEIPELEKLTNLNLSIWLPKNV